MSIKKIKSPLRYTGGKYWLIDKIWDFIPEHTQEMVSPFFGGGALEINLAYNRDIKIYGYDIEPILVNFWRYWLKDPESIIGDARGFCHSHSRDELRTLKAETLLSDKPLYLDYQMAVYFYLFNRLSYQGLTLNSSVIYFECSDDKILRSDGANLFLEKDWEYANSINIEIQRSDFEKTLLEHTDKLAYLDPPYLGAEAMYKQGENVFDHHALGEILKSRGNWILSYGHLPQVPYGKLVYQDYPMLEFYRQTTFRKAIRKKSVSELLIFSHDIAEQIQQSEQLNLFERSNL